MMTSTAIQEATPMTRRRYMSWQFELLENALAANTTIALRTFDAMFSAAAGKRPDARENTRMVAEKMEAFSSGLLAAGLACHRLWWQAALTGRLTPAAAWLQLARAASQPARVKVRGNAKRLTRRSR
jgi:hypothetical protein